jgi:hypothetical protein
MFESDPNAYITYICSLIIMEMTTIIFNCNDLPVATMETILQPVQHGLVGKTWERNHNESFSRVFRYKEINLTKGLINTIQSNNGIIIH